MYAAEYEQEFNAIFSKNLRSYLNINKMNQAELAKKLNVSSQSVTNWCKGTKSPRMDKVDAMCKIFNCKRSDLMEEHTSNPQRQAKTRTIDVLGRVAAGIPLNAITDIIDTEEITEDLAKTGDFFGLKIKGDSMEPRIYDGDVVIVRQQNDAESGDIVIAMVNGDDAVCKRLVKYATSIALVSLNSKYEPMMFTNDEIETKPVKIIGKVVELRGKL